MAFFLTKVRYLSNNFSKLFNFIWLFSFFTSLINYNCSFILNLNSLKKRLMFIGISNLNIVKLNLALFAPFFFNFNYTYIYKSYFYNSLLHRIVNNFYFTDIFTNNSRILSICALYSYKKNFSINNSLFVN